MSLTVSTVIDNLESICTKHTSLGATKFFRTDTEMAEAVRSLDGFAMLMNPLSGRLGGDNDANINKYFNVGFCITKPWQAGDNDSMQTILTDCERIAFDLLARIRYFNVGLEGSPTLFAFFRFDEVTFETVALTFDNRIGFEVNFRVYDQISMAWDATDAAGRWTDFPV